MALFRFPSSVTYASLGYRLPTWLVRGITWTRFKNLFEASLLMMTAGLRFRISPPTADPKFTHHTSPRFIGDLSQCAFNPFQCFRLAIVVMCHAPISRLHVSIDDMRANQRFNKLADVSTSDNTVQACVYFFVDCDRQLLSHE